MKPDDFRHILLQDIEQYGDLAKDSINLIQASLADVVRQRRDYYKTLITFVLGILAIIPLINKINVVLYLRLGVFIMMGILVFLFLKLGEELDSDSNELFSTLVEGNIFTKRCEIAIKYLEKDFSNEDYNLYVQDVAKQDKIVREGSEQAKKNKKNLDFFLEIIHFGIISAVTFLVLAMYIDFPLEWWKLVILLSVEFIVVFFAKTYLLTSPFNYILNRVRNKVL